MNNTDTIEFLKKMYPQGCRVRLYSMDDPYHRLERGSEGTVEYIDSAGTIKVLWDNGQRIGLIYGEDLFMRL